LPASGAAMHHRRRHNHDRHFHRCRCCLIVDYCIPSRCLCFRRHR
jgi:hypothetical protein